MIDTKLLETTLSCLFIKKSPHTPEEHQFVDEIKGMNYNFYFQTKITAV